MDGIDRWLREMLRQAGEIYFKWVEEQLGTLNQALFEWLSELFEHPSANWREGFAQFVASQEAEGRIILPESRQEVLDYLESWWTTLKRPVGTATPKAEPVQLAMGLILDDDTRTDATMLVMPPDESRPRNSGNLNPADYTTASQQTIWLLGADWNDVSVAVISMLERSGQAVKQKTGAVIGSGSNALNVEAFVRLDRRDGGTDTVCFRFVMSLFTPVHFEFIELKRGVVPRAAADALAAQDRIRHDDVMRVRGGINRFQGGMFAIVGGVAGIVEGAPLLGALEAVAGAEQIALAGTNLATGKENPAWSARAIQSVLERAGVDPVTAKFLAENGGLLIGLSKASVDAAGTAHAVIETSTGYQIRLDFDPATLSANGLGGAKIKVTKRLAPDGTEIKPIGGRFPINSGKYAGRVMPASAWPKEVARKYPEGVRFTSEGFPDFTPYKTKQVRLQNLTGNRRKDFDAANKAAGLGETPHGYTWHHHEDGVTMQLVPEDLHDVVRHTGGVAIILHATPQSGESM